MRLKEEGQGEEKGRGQGKGRKSRKKYKAYNLQGKMRSILSYSILELLTLCLPFITFSFWLFLVMYVGHDPSTIQLLHYILPDDYKNIGSFLILMVIDSWLILFGTAVSFFVIFTQLMSLQRFWETPRRS